MGKVVIPEGGDFTSDSSFDEGSVILFSVRYS
jgi:hypothetical protein